MDRGEVFSAQRVKILIDILIRQITAQEDAVNLAVLARQLDEGSVGLALGDELVKALEVEAG